MQAREFVDGNQRKDSEPDNFKIVSDQQRLQQIILNLVSNALKFTPLAGYIKIDLEVHRNSKVTSEGFIKVECEDNGVGISKKNQKKLFKLFGFLNDTKTMNKKGIGLGLAISKKIINQFGGDIKVRSAVNEGSTFYFTMKLEDEKEFFKEHIVLNLESDSEDEQIIQNVEKPLMIKQQAQAQKEKVLNDSGTEIAHEDINDNSIAPCEMGIKLNDTSDPSKAQSVREGEKVDTDLPKINKRGTDA